MLRHWQQRCNDGASGWFRGTDNHLMLLDLRSVSAVLEKNGAADPVMTGKRADRLMEEIHITANKNTIPFDPQPPFVASGLRLGSPALTTRGLGAAEFEEIGEIIADCLFQPGIWLCSKTVAGEWPSSAAVFRSTPSWDNRSPLRGLPCPTWLPFSLLPVWFCGQPQW